MYFSDFLNLLELSKSNLDLYFIVQFYAFNVFIILNHFNVEAFIF